jgi:hypothetical protein
MLLISSLGYQGIHSIFHPGAIQVQWYRQQSEQCLLLLLGRGLLASLESNGTQFYLADSVGSMVFDFSNASGGGLFKSNELFGLYGNNRSFADTISNAKSFTGQYNDSQTG